MNPDITLLPQRRLRIRLRTVSVALVATFSLLGVAMWQVSSPVKLYPAGDRRLVQVGSPERGKLVFLAGECASCHAAPGQSDRLKLGGGIALSSPFGTFRPPNISSDPVDGIGRWKVEDLANALVGGVSPDGKHYYPAFPYTSYTGMTDRDIVDLFAYLRTLPAVKGRAPPHTPTILFSIRRSVGFWKLLFFQPMTGEGTGGGGSMDRGRYLVNALSHCAECHSSRNAFGAIKQRTRFAGGIDPSGVGYVPNITPGGIGSWSQEELVKMLTDGMTPDHGRVGSSMSDVVSNTSMLPDADREAVAVYVKSLPPKPTPQP